MYKTKGFITGATLLALVVISGSIGLACGTEPAPAPHVPPLAPTTPPASSELTPPPPSLPPTSTDLDIPANYTTYTDESNYFSISYPSDWEPALSYIGAIEEEVKKTINDLKTGMSVERVSIIFLSGRRTADGFEPSVNIVVERAPEGIWTHDLVVESAIGEAKKVFSDYRELSRVNTTVDGKEATIVEWESTLQGQDKLTLMQMFMLIDRTCWTVTCTVSSEDFAQWENDFNTILRSLRISY